MRIDRFEFDADYIRRLVSADPETERHFTEYFGRLLSIKLRSRLRTAAQIEDAKQETFVRVLSTLKEKGGIQAAGSLGAYVNGVCNFVLFEMYRGNARTTPIGDDYDEMDTRAGSESNLIASEEREKVREALSTLPQRERDLAEVVILRGTEQGRNLSRTRHRPRLPARAPAPRKEPVSSQACGTFKVKV